MGKAGENGTEPFGGKTQTVPEDHAAEVHDRREGNQRWGQSRKSGVGNESRDNRTQGRGRKLERNTPGTRAGRPVEDRYRSRIKMVTLAMERDDEGIEGAILQGGYYPNKSRKRQRDPRGPRVIYPGNPR